MSISFLEQFDKHKTSQAPALICGSISLTYAELHVRSLALAAKLRSLGVGLDSTEPDVYDIFDPKSVRNSPWVIVISDRSADAVIGVIAAWMAGGAYVLMEKNAPDAYINGIVEDTAAAFIFRDGEAYETEKIEGFTYAFPKESEIACAVFTSGSTGSPKGAVLEHRVINEMLRWQADYMKPAGWTATAAYAPFSFIAATWELFFPLANGLTLHILDDTLRHDLFALESYIEKNNISYLFLPPDVAEIFTGTYRGSALKYLRVAGGRLGSCGDPGGGYEIMYHLGMAENGGSVTFKSISNAMDCDISIGKPWKETRVYLDGETGEIAVSGPSLFRGYLSRKEETGRVRVKNPCGGEPEYEMMYLSGDLARPLENGEFVHMGRKDFTVKIRDMKVNPIQVENALGQCAGVTDCCVTAQSQGGENILIGWVTGNADEESIRKALADRLPEHMIPSFFFVLDKLPRNINGKVDRSALMYSPTERKGETAVGMAALFERVLGRGAGEDDNFFAFGGDSLKLMRLQAEIAREFSINIPYTALLKNPTPREISVLLRNQSSLIHIPSAAYMDAFPLSGPMRQMWLLWRTGQDGGKYTVSIKCRFTGDIDKSRVIAAFQELTRRHAILRSHFAQRGGDAFQVVGDSVNVAVCERARREFDLTAAPLFDITLNENILSFTTHHIIADATGLRVLMEDFWTLYSGCEPSVCAQAHDVTMWSLDADVSADEEYWRQNDSVKISMPVLPFDFPHPARLTSASRKTVFFGGRDAASLREYAASCKATIFQLFLSAYALILSKLSGGGSVVIGAPFSGREHPGTARTIGMLVRTLPVRLDVSGMELGEALVYTRERFADAWEHQSVSLERLTEITGHPRTMSGNSFYDVMINYVPLPRPLPNVCGLRPEILRGEYSGALFDLVLDVREENDGFSAVFTYADELFRPETVSRWADTFKKLLLTHELDLAYTAVPNHTEDAGTVFEENAPQLTELSRVWMDVLGSDDVSPHDDFFVAGGTSLAAIRIEAGLFERGFLLCAADILQNPKMYEMAALMVPADEINWEEEA